MPTPIDSTEVKLQTDCKRAAHDEPSGGITRRHRGQSEEVRQGIILHRPTPTLRTLGKLITQRSQVQILSPQQAKRPGHKGGRETGAPSPRPGCKRIANAPGTAARQATVTAGLGTRMTWCALSIRNANGEQARCSAATHSCLGFDSLEFSSRPIPAGAGGVSAPPPSENERENMSRISRTLVIL